MLTTESVDIIDVFTLLEGCCAYQAENSSMNMNEMMNEML